MIGVEVSQSLVRIRLGRAFAVVECAEVQIVGVAPEETEGAVLLLRRDGGGEPMLASPHMSRLLRSASAPTPLPNWLLGEADAFQILGRLVYDRVIEVQIGGSGWSAGPRAAQPFLSAAGGFARGVSTAAMRLALLARGESERTLWGLLYRYGRLPYSGRFLRSLGGRGGHSLSQWYGLERADTRRVLSRHWRQVGRSEAWWIWRSHTVAAGKPGLAWKLYLNVQPLWLPAVLGEAVSTLAAHDARAFKVAGSAEALVRPDKVVAYFRTEEAMHRAGTALEAACGGVPVQALPFTPQLSGTGLVSWGIDPPARRGGVWVERGSWRWWLSGRIARALKGIRGGIDEATALSLVGGRVRADGVDPSIWRPLPELVAEWASV